MAVFVLSTSCATENYSLSLHDALPIFARRPTRRVASSKTRAGASSFARGLAQLLACSEDRKSTRLNSSHMSMSYAGVCLKKKIENEGITPSAICSLILLNDVPEVVELE